MTPLGILRQIISGLTCETSPLQIAGGFAMGIWLGLVPKANLTAQLILLAIMAFRINAAVALLAAVLVSLINPLTDLIAGPLGYMVLTAPVLKSLWTCLYNIPIVPWTGFNNTLVTGNLVLGALLFMPSFLLGKKAGNAYALKWQKSMNESAFIKAAKKTWLLEWYFRIT